VELEKSALEIEYASGGVLALFLENFYELALLPQSFYVSSDTVMAIK
jgi:hypothetical protein